MAYRLKRGETVPEAIKRVVREELEDSVAQLTGKGEANRDEGIHEARKSVKKVRGALRLVRTELGDLYGVENARLRDIGRELSHFRDAGAIIETFDAFKEKYRDQLGRRTLASVRRGLLARKKQAEKQANIERVLGRMAAALRRAAKHVEAWPLVTDGVAAILPGLETTYRQGQKAMARVRKHPRPENYHEWRKRVKDHWYHVRLLESLWTDVMQAHEKSLKQLEDWLGEDHNLVVLREKVQAEPGFYGSNTQIEFLFDLLDQYHKELRENALAAGVRIYAEKPRQFSKSMKRLWDAWQAAPKGPSRSVAAKSSGAHRREAAALA
jgi:CHAD domain-containing protein